MPIEVGYDANALLGLPTEQPLGERERLALLDNLRRRQRNEDFQLGMVADSMQAANQGQLLNQRLSAQQQLEQQRQQVMAAQAKQEELDRQNRLQMESDLRQAEWYERNTPTDLGAPATPDQVANSQQRIEANQQAISAPSQAQQARLIEAIQSGDPQAAQQGLQQGLLRYTDAQKAERRKIIDSIGRIDNDPRMTPDQRAGARRQQLGRLHSIRPQLVPPDEVPLDPVQDMQQRIITMPDPITGRPSKWALDRNGVPKEVVTEWDKAEAAAWLQQQTGKDQVALQQVEMEREQRKAQLEHWKAKKDAAMEMWKARTEAWESRMDAELDARIRENEKLEPSQKRDPTKIRQEVTDKIVSQYGARPELALPDMPDFGPPPTTQDGMNPYGAPIQSASPWSDVVPPQQQAPPPEGQMNVPDQAAAAPPPMEAQEAMAGQEQAAPAIEPLSPEWFAQEPALEPLADEYRRKAEGKKYGPMIKNFEATFQNPAMRPLKEYEVMHGAVYNIGGRLFVGMRSGAKARFAPLPGG